MEVHPVSFPGSNQDGCAKELWPQGVRRLKSRCVHTEISPLWRCICLFSSGTKVSLFVAALVQSSRTLSHTP